MYSSSPSSSSLLTLKGTIWLVKESVLPSAERYKLWVYWKIKVVVCLFFWCLSFLRCILTKHERITHTIKRERENKMTVKLDHKIIFHISRIEIQIKEFIFVIVVRQEPQTSLCDQQVDERVQVVVEHEMLIIMTEVGCTSIRVYISNKWWERANLYILGYSKSVWLSLNIQILPVDRDITTEQWQAFPRLWFSEIMQLYPSSNSMEQN